MPIAERNVALFHYKLRNDAGEVLDASPDGKPLAYIHGGGNIIRGLEKAMEGRNVGDRFSVTVSAEEGYGPRVEELVQQVPRNAFPEDVEIRPGMRFQAESNVGRVNVVVTEVGEESVTVDGNHPLAGETLHFDVEVVEVREASAEEVLHGHVHGPGGHEH
jgi:FKBP-type peptidyl-prolyl cis-trans isomerases 2